jgi:hypothetical protein
MADCSATTLESFVTCLLRNLRRGAGTTLAGLDPSACRVVEEARLTGLLPVDLCTASGGGQCPEPPPAPPSGPLYCGGPDAVACPEGMVCHRTDALCTHTDASGVCVPLPESCGADGDPVCGCDGETYASDCHRLLAGAVRRHEGACAPPAAVCGGGEPACAPGTFCEYPRADCGEGQPGVCQPLHDESCDLCVAMLGGPVCGCDLVTYASECERRAAGVSKWFDGACPF